MKDINLDVNLRWWRRKNRFNNFIFAQNGMARMERISEHKPVALFLDYIDIRSLFEISVVRRRAEPFSCFRFTHNLRFVRYTRAYTHRHSGCTHHSRYITKMHTSADSTERFLLLFFFFFFFIFRGNRFRSRETFVWKRCERTSGTFYIRSWLLL